MPTAPPNREDSETYESTHVHDVYNQIAPHFSQTRYKPWPLISRFLLSLPAGSIGLDLGCGNGRYLNTNPDIFIIGSDRSGGLVNIARREKKGGSSDVIVGDILDLPHQTAKFDFAISIAVVHHLSTRERRVEAIKLILETLRPGGTDGMHEAGKALVYVWALEQKTSRRGWDKGDEQDVMVPWIMKQKAEDGESGTKEKTFERYYHLYRKGELEEDVEAAGGKIFENGYERDNWWAVASPRRAR